VENKTEMMQRVLKSVVSFLAASIYITNF